MPMAYIEYMNSNETRIQWFEREATAAIARVNRISEQTPLNSKQARNELRGWRLRSTTRLLNVHLYNKSDVQAAWDRAVIAARVGYVDHDAR